MQAESNQDNYRIGTSLAKHTVDKVAMTFGITEFLAIS